MMAKRKTIFELEAELKTLRVPTLIMAGDQDAPYVEPSLLMRAWIPHARLVPFPASGHTGSETAHYTDRAVGIVADNLRRFSGGEPLRNVSDKHLHY